MPGAVLVDLEARIADLVEQHRPQLVALIDQALAAELDRLVAERLAAARNGAPHAWPPVFVPAVKPTTKTCVSCGQDKPTSAFEKHRRACRDCRRGEMRERAQQRRDRDHGQPADVEEPPRTDTGPAGDDPSPVT